MDSANSGSWNICAFKSCFSSNFIRMVSFLRNVCQLHENSECLDIAGRDVNCIYDRKSRYVSMLAITNGLALPFILNTRCVKNYISSTYLGL